MYIMRLPIRCRAIMFLFDWIIRDSLPGSNRSVSCICFRSIMNWTWLRSLPRSLWSFSDFVWEIPDMGCSCFWELRPIGWWRRKWLRQWSRSFHWYRYWLLQHSSAVCWQVRSSERISTIWTGRLFNVWNMPSWWITMICSNYRWYWELFRYYSVWCWRRWIRLFSLVSNMQWQLSDGSSCWFPWQFRLCCRR